MAENLPNVDGEHSPTIDDATFVDMSGFHGLSPEELWDAVGDAGNVAPWALIEANRLAGTGLTPKEAFLAGVGWFLRAQRSQQRRDADKTQILAAFQGALADETPVISADHT